MISHPDPAALALRIERAEAEQLALAGAPGPAGALAVAGGIAVSKGPRSPFSAAFGLGLGGRVTPDDLALVEAHLGAVGGDVRIELCAHADPDLGVELARRGYAVERFHQVWWRRPGPIPIRRNGVRVRRVEAGEERAFAEAFARAHLGGAPPPPAAAEAILALARAEGNVCFAAFDGAAVVAVAIASAHGRVATLSAAGVVPERRGHGLQLALVAARLAWAEERGCDVAACATAPGTASQRTLEKAGFRAAYPKAVMVRRA
jgi:GNAT superfamily N-acetyltransferase